MEKSLVELTKQWLEEIEFEDEPTLEEEQESVVEQIRLDFFV